MPSPPTASAVVPGPERVHPYLRLLQLLRPYRGRMACALACMVVYSLASTLQLKLVGPFTKAKQPDTMPQLTMMRAIQRRAPT